MVFGGGNELANLATTMMMPCPLNEDVKRQCTEALAKIGASSELTRFYADAVQCEYDITHTIYRLQGKLKDDCDGALPPHVVFGLLQTMTKHFRSWKSKIESLAEQGIAVPPFQVDNTTLANSQVLTAICSMETNGLNLHEGDQLFITDASHPNWLRVKNSRGEEGYVPAMSCIIPTPDNSAVTAVERLQIILLTSWTECIRKLRSLLMSTLIGCSQNMTTQLRTYQSLHPSEIGKEKLTMRMKRIIDCASSSSSKGIDLGKLHRYLSKLENDLMLFNSSNGLLTMKQMVEGLDRAVLGYQTFYGQWSNFRSSLNMSSRPIRIVEQWEELRRASHCKHSKYYEMKMTLEEMETHDEITYVNAETGETYTSECRQKRQSVSSEKLTSTTQEERKRFLIRGVIDPRTDTEVPFRKAVEDGIIDHRKGLYLNPDTGEGVPISDAMLHGRIIVEYTSVFRSPPKSGSVALITIRHRQDRRYTITGAIDAITAERVDTTEAMRRGLIDETEGQYVNALNNTRLPIEEAVEDGWILANFDDTEPQYSSETFAVIGVIDQRRKKVVSFVQAVRQGLIDRATGNYVNNETGKEIYVGDAIRQELLKTKKLENPLGVDIFAEGNLVIENGRPLTPHEL